MRIRLNDPRVSKAYEVLKKQHNEYDAIKFAKIFENVYHCKVVADPEDVFCLNGWIDIPDEKYQNWFVLQFGA